MAFRERLRQPDALIVDGALGTELERRGVPTPEPLWSAQALLLHQDAVQQIHAAYVESGADILTANTFRTNERAVERARLAGRAEHLTHRAVALAREAADAAARPVWVAGSISPVEDCFSPWLVPDDAALAREHGLLAAWLAGAGVDLILIETMNCIREAYAAAQAALSTGLPVLVSFVCSEDGHLLSGESLADAASALAPLGPDGLLVNCIPTPHVETALRNLAQSTTLPIGAYGNLGPPVASDRWELEDAIGPQRYAAYVSDWLALGARIVGGCCGTTPAHIATLRRLVSADSDAS
ncbi:MAG: homocysteine S-methyltransferase family protein [Thermomicrobiales bacterium]|nr:homocysteine S-methyltransferase family protein [Thermomicrobiales bacterium]